MDDLNDVPEYDSDFQFNELSKMIRFEDNVHLFSLVNNLRNNREIFDEIQFENINDIYFEFELNEDLLKELPPTDANIGQNLDCDDYCSLIDDFKNAGKIFICSQFEQNKLATIKEQNLTDENRKEESIEEKSKFLRQWISDTELKCNRNGSETDGTYQAEQFMLKLVQKTHYTEWMKKRCFLCLDKYFKVKTMRCDQAAIFTHDNCTYSRFVCFDCHQYATTILDYLNQMDFSIDFPPIRIRQKAYKINEVIETIAGRDRRRTKSIRDLLETSFVHVHEHLDELERLFERTVNELSAKNILGELRVVMGAARSLYEMCRRLDDAYLVSLTNSDWRLDFVELTKCTLTKENILMSLKGPSPPLSPSPSNQEQQKDCVLSTGALLYCKTTATQPDSFDHGWKLAKVIGVELEARRVEIVWLDQFSQSKKELKLFHEIASFFISPNSFPVSATVICSFVSDSQNEPIFVTGQVLETPKAENYFRYLIWFETNEYRYVYHYMMRALLYADNTKDSLRVPPDQFDSKTKLSLSDQNTVFIKHNDVYETALVLIIDCSLVLLEHLDCKKLEWKLISDTVLFKQLN